MWIISLRCEDCGWEGTVETEEDSIELVCERCPGSLMTWIEIQEGIEESQWEEVYSANGV